MTENQLVSVDRLYGLVAVRGNVCVGLDTALEYVPPRAASEGCAAILRYNTAIIDATLDVCACYKVQIAYYEALGLAGLDIYAKTLAYLRERGALCIADIKRGDIADTAVQYAKAHFSGDFEADMVTLNPYMGMDSIEPWLLEAQARGKGAFVLLRTSNKGFADVEGQKTARGGFVYDLIGEKLLLCADKAHGRCGYGVMGAVVGAEAKTEEDQKAARMLRSRYERLFFLIPGYGAQGGGAAEAAALLRPDKNGGVVNASRSLLKAWCSAPNTENMSIEDAAGCARDAAIAMRDAIRAA